MVFNTVNFVEGYVLGENNGRNEESDIVKIDRLPTWGEVILDNGWSIKIKKSDEIATTDRFTFSTHESTSPYLHTYERTWTIYFCVYHGGQLLFGNTIQTHTSQQWSWSMWNSDTPWLNVYCGHNYNKILSISAEKISSSCEGLTGINVNFTFGIEWFFYRYDINGNIDINGETHDSYKDDTGRYLTPGGFDFYVKDDYQKRAEDIMAFGLAVTNSKKFEYKIYDV